MNRQAWASQRQHTFGGSKQHSVEYDEVEVTCMEKFKREMKSKWIIWVIIIILAAVTVHEVVQILSDYFRYPKISEMNMMFNESMDMPNVTFCMPESLARGHLKMNVTEDVWDAYIHEQIEKRPTREEFLAPGWTHEMYQEAYDVIANLNSLERETHPQGLARSINNMATNPRLKGSVEKFAFWLDAIHKRNVTFQEFTDKVGRGVLSMSLMAFQRLTYNDSEPVVPTGLKISWISVMQMCFQPTFEKIVNITDMGNFFKLQLKHDNVTLFAQAHECMSVDFHGRPSSSARFMSAKGSIKDGYTDSLCISQRSGVTVSVRAMYDMLENDDPQTKCRKYDREDGAYVENEFDCRSRCRLKLIQNFCNCTANTLSYLQSPEQLKKSPYCDYAKCAGVDPENLETTDKCDSTCYRDCKQIRFETDFEDEGPMVNKLVTLVSLSWGAFEYLTLKQRWEWTPSTLLAALGGSIGMWLGLSILAVIQAIDFITKMMTREVKLKRKQTKVKRQQTLDHGDEHVDPYAGKKRNPSGNTDPKLSPDPSH